MTADAGQPTVARGGEQAVAPDGAAGVASRDAELRDRARRVIPGLWGMDLATFVLAWFTEVVLLFILIALRGADLRTTLASLIVGACLLAAIKIIKMSIYILMVAVIIQAILSWVNPYSPVMPLINSLTLPFLRPLQKRVPTVANVDLSPLVSTERNIEEGETPKRTRIVFSD